MQQSRLLVVIATDVEHPQDGIGEVLVSGVGKSAAATAAALRLAEGGIDAVISFGIAGAYPGSELAVGDVVIATEVAVVDEGLETGTAFRRFERPGMAVPGAEWSPTDPVLRSRLAGPAEGFAVAEGRIATVSVCAGTARLATERGAEGVLAEGMEGAAIALAAARHGVAFAEVRGISNPCGPRDGAPFDLESAVRNANVVLRRLAGAS